MVINVDCFEQSLLFYDQTLKVLGCERLVTIDNDYVQCAGYGDERLPKFWISPTQHTPKLVQPTTQMVSLAFFANERSLVDLWFGLCIERGGTSVAKPASRPHFHHNFYSACVLDPDGWRLEACCYD